MTKEEQEAARAKDLKTRICVVPKSYETLQDGGPPAKPHKFASYVVEWDGHPINGAATPGDAEQKAATLRQNIAAGKDDWKPFKDEAERAQIMNANKRGAEIKR